MHRVPETPDAQIEADFTSLIANEEADENDIQRFLEFHTSFIETPHLLNHHLHLNSVISKFPIGSWKTDFAYLTKSTVAWRLVLMELEHPKKRIFLDSSSHSGFTAEFNSAIAQIDTWRDHWNSHKHSIVSQLDPLLVPTSMRKNAITPHYSLVYGRDAELNKNDARKKRLASLMQDKDLHVYTYDTLLRSYKSGRGYRKCVLSPTAAGYRIKSLDGTPGSLFAYVELQHLNVSSEIEEKLVAWGYDIPSWRSGKPLTVNDRLPFDLKRETNFAVEAVISAHKNSKEDQT